MYHDVCPKCHAINQRDAQYYPDGSYSMHCKFCGHVTPRIRMTVTTNTETKDGTWLNYRAYVEGEKSDELV